MARYYLITDLDNTLYNWVDFFAPSFRGAVHALHKATGISEDLISHSFREVFQERGSLEYPAQARELAIFANTSQTELEALNRVIFGSFNRVFNATLRLYDGALECLNWCYGNRIPVIALTNAPLSLARRRLIHLGVNKYFKALAAPRSFEQGERSSRIEPNLALFPEDEDPSRRRLDDRLNCIYELSDSEMKPSPAGFERIMSDLMRQDSSAFAIGDSLLKDLAPAHKLGAVTIWAKFGTKVDLNNMQTLYGITPWSAKQIETAYCSKFEPDYTAESWQDVTGFLKRSVGI